MNDWQKRSFGETGLCVSALGLGAGQIGDATIPEHDVMILLNSALDLGITLIDTARGYGLSEERIGRHLRHRRDEYVLSTKIGYGIPGYDDWTGPCIVAGVDAALARLQTDHLDIVHLHSCPVDVLENTDVIDALQSTVRAGKVRIAAYSGDNEALRWAVQSGRFSSIETSINFCDQRVIAEALPEARERNLGVIAKRPVANAPWRYAERPVGNYAEVYWERLQAMHIDPAPYEWQELALRFTAYLPGVQCCIVGTRSLDHLRHNVELMAKGPLPPETVTILRSTFEQNDRNWITQT